MGIKLNDFMIGTILLLFIGLIVGAQITPAASQIQFKDPEKQRQYEEFKKRLREHYRERQQVQGVPYGQKKIIQHQAACFNPKEYHEKFITVLGYKPVITQRHPNGLHVLFISPKGSAVMAVASKHEICVFAGIQGFTDEQYHPQNVPEKITPPPLDLDK